METCARRMLSPVFAWFRRAVPSYGSVVRVEDENEIAFRLLGWLRSQRVSYDRVRVGSTIDFWWSFVDVDLDLENWGDRLPLVPMVTALIDAGPCGRDLSDTLARAVRLRQLDRLLASPFGPTWAVQLRRSPECEMHALRALRHHHVHLLRSVQRVAWRLGVHPVVGVILDFLWGGCRWVDTLAATEQPATEQPAAVVVTRAPPWVTMAR